MLRIIHILYSLYAITLFFSLLTIAFIPYCLVKIIISYNLQLKYVYLINRSILFIWTILTGFHFTLDGKDLVNKNETYIVIINHLNVIDMLIIAQRLSIPAKPLIKKELLKIPILGWILSIVALPIDRNDRESRHRSKLKMNSEIDQNISMLIFPEGTQNRTSKPMNEFQDGAFKLAITTQTKILPVVILNSRTKANASSAILKPGHVKIKYLDPVDPQEFDNVQILKNHCFKVMESAIYSNDRFFQSHQ